MNSRLISLSTLLILLISFQSCKKSSKEDYKAKASDPELLHKCSEQLTDVIVFDIFKPPVASRIYSYAYLAGYETLRNERPKYPTLAGKLNGFEAVPAPEKGQTYCFPLASVTAVNTIGRTLTFSSDLWDTFEKDFYAQYKNMDIPDDVYQRSVEYGQKVAKHILAYADKDNYKRTRGIRHTIARKEGTWTPTPPTYAEACEPRWTSIRSFTLDSASQFPCTAPTAYSPDKNSEFFKLVTEVHDLSKNLTEEQRNIAYFWDDNALVTNIKGHVSFAEKKMTPPGHWVAITRSLTKAKKSDMMKSLEAYTISSIAVFDGFIACWDEKYKSDRIRPVTVINQSIDPDWLPFLETPPFPEYVSGHSAISASAGRVLSHIYGNNVSFTDSTEYKYGHGVRSFTSLEQAYWETSMSRVYGGIHFKDGVEEGTRQGEKVGEWVWAKIKLSHDKKDVIAKTAF